MNCRILTIASGILICLIPLLSWSAEIKLYVRNDCVPCQHLQKHLEIKQLEKKDFDLQVIEIQGNMKAYSEFFQVLKKHKLENFGVPIALVHGQALAGYNQVKTARSIEALMGWRSDHLSLPNELYFKAEGRAFLMLLGFLGELNVSVILGLIAAVLIYNYFAPNRLLLGLITGAVLLPRLGQLYWGFSFNDIERALIIINPSLIWMAAILAAIFSQRIQVLQKISKSIQLTFALICLLCFQYPALFSKSNSFAIFDSQRTVMTYAHGHFASLIFFVSSSLALAVIAFGSYKLIKFIPKSRWIFIAALFGIPILTWLA